MQAIDYAKALIKGKFLRIVMPEAGDERIRAAATILHSQGAGCSCFVRTGCARANPGATRSGSGQAAKNDRGHGRPPSPETALSRSRHGGDGRCGRHGGRRHKPHRPGDRGGRNDDRPGAGVCHAFQLFSHAVARTPPDLCRLRRERAAHGRATGRHRHCLRRKCRQNTGRGTAPGHAVILDQGQRQSSRCRTRSWPPCRSSASAIPKF